MRAIVLVLACALAQTQTAGPLGRAYTLLSEKRYDEAVTLFREALDADPRRAATRQDLAYTYLKIGETERARDEFGEALRLEPGNQQAALEYAFLCNDTGRRGEARRIFQSLRDSSATAARAFENIDRPLREGIQRWQAALALGGDNFSNHYELARLAEDRGDWPLAAEHYQRAWRLLPGRRTVLVSLGRAWNAMGKTDQALAAWLAASRGGSPRAAEEAREWLPARYPFVYEFRAALDLDPGNAELRRELAYLLLRMQRPAEAEEEFRALTASQPGDLLSAAQLGFLYLARGQKAAAMPLLERVLRGQEAELAARVRAVLRLPQPIAAGEHTGAREARLMAERSIRAGYMKDALRYLLLSQEFDPGDFATMVRLGWTYNILHDDANAARWFDLARQSPDPQLASEAARAWRNLRGSLARLRTTVWAFPVYSSRWSDLFSYAQAKVELRVPGPLRPYVSARLMADVRGYTTQWNGVPQGLSENAVIFAFGVTTPVWHGLYAWGEAGSAVGFRSGHRVPDYRGGLAFARTFGRPLGGESRGVFWDLSGQALYISRFERDTLVYLQSRLGYTWQPGPLRLQFYLNANGTVDLGRQYWANFAESGPGLRFRWQSWPAPVFCSLDWLRGAYTLNLEDPRGPRYSDLRAGIWYAFTY